MLSGSISNTATLHYSDFREKWTARIIFATKRIFEKLEFHLMYTSKLRIKIK